MHEPSTSLDGRVAVLERGLNDMVSNVNTFIISQREENTRLYTAINAIGEKLSNSFGTLQAALAARGQVTGSFVLMLIATGLSLIAIIGGVAHFYVSDQVGNTKADIERLRIQMVADKAETNKTTADIATKLVATLELLNDERIRSIKADAEHETETRVTKELKKQ